MTVPANLNRVDYTGTGSTGPFTVPFPFYDASHLTVLQTDALFNQTTLTGWTATGAGGPSGAVTLAAACPVGSTLTIMREVPLTQITSIKNQEAFYPEIHEKEFDLLTMADQQLDETLDRTLRLPAGLSGVDMTLPRPDPGHALVWNAAGDGLENAGAPSATLQQDLADSTDVAKGDAMISVTQPFTGAVARTQHAKNAEFITPEDFGAVGDGTTNDTVAIQSAITAASTNGLRLRIPAKTYKIVPATLVDWEGSIYGEPKIIAAFLLKSNLTIEADSGARFKIADGISSDLTPKNYAMFFSNEVLSNIKIVGLIMDMNGQNNPISPNRGALIYNRFQCAQIHFSGTFGGQAARATNVLIDSCIFQNNPGVTCIGMCQTNDTGSPDFSSTWTIRNCRFENVGTDTDDHSSVFSMATNVMITNNLFINPLPYNNTTHTGGLCACELHGSNSTFIGNRIINYYQGLWVTGNQTEDYTHDFVICDNTARLQGVFVDFWSKNTLPAYDGFVAQVNISNNTLEITNDAVNDSIKCFLRVGSRAKPDFVKFSNNICRSYSTSKDCILVSWPLYAAQDNKGTGIEIQNNTCYGLTAGLAVYFNGDVTSETTRNAGSITFANNKLGPLGASLVGIPSVDIFLYGPNQGIVESLRCYGLEHATVPISTDGHANGRAYVYGQALVPATVTWNSVTIGNGSIVNRCAIDTDKGYARVSTYLTAGSSSTASGNIYLIFSGLTANSSTGTNYNHFKTGSAAVLPAIISNTANYISLHKTSGALFDSAEFDTSSIIMVDAHFPCDKVFI